MILRIIKVVLFFTFFITFNAQAEKIVIVDINSLISNSSAGQSIKLKIKEEKENLAKLLKKKEDNLKEQEKKLVSQKNVLSEEEFKKKAKSFNEKLNLYKKEKKKQN